MQEIAFLAQLVEQRYRQTCLPPSPIPANPREPALAQASRPAARPASLDRDALVALHALTIRSVLRPDEAPHSGGPAPDHTPTPPGNHPVGCGQRKPFCPQSAWCHDVTEDGDVESNPGPKHSKSASSSTNAQKFNRLAFFGQPLQTLESSPLQWSRDLTQEGIEPNPGPSQEDKMITDDELASNPAPPIPPPASPSHASPTEDAPPDAIASDFQSLAGAHQSQAYGLHLRQVESSGEWFDQKPLGTTPLLKAIHETTPQRVDNWLIGDGLPNPHLPAPISCYRVFSHTSLTPTHLAGKHSVLLVSAPLPFDDTPPVFSLRSWCQLFRQTFSEAAQNPTHVSIILLARTTSPKLELIPLLDKRFELDILKAWRTGIWILPDIHLAERNPATGAIHPNAWPTVYPLMLHTFSTERSKGKRTIAPTVRWTAPPPPHALEAPPESRAHHVLLNAPSSVASPGDSQRQMSATRLLMMLNCLDPGEASTQFRHSPSLRYPPTWLPHIQRAAPSTITIAHYHVPLHIVECLIEDMPLLLEMGIRWCLLGHSSAYIVNHRPQPGKGSKSRPFKCPADEILDTLLAPPTIQRLFSTALAFSRWDVYVELQPGVDPPALADSLRNLDNLLLSDASTQAVIAPTTAQNVVAPPLIFLVCPPALLIQYALDQVAKATSIRHHQRLERPGHLLLTMEHEVAAKALAGCHIPCQGVGAIILTTGSPDRDALLNAESGIRPGAPLHERQPFLNPLGRSVLSIENVAASAQNPKNGGPDPTDPTHPLLSTSTDSDQENDMEGQGSPLLH